MKAEERERLMAILLPAVQNIRETARRSWELSPNGILVLEADLSDEEQANLKEAIGKPDIRIISRRSMYRQIGRLCYCNLRWPLALTCK